MYLANAVSVSYSRPTVPERTMCSVYSPTFMFALVLRVACMLKLGALGKYNLYTGVSYIYEYGSS